MKLDYLQLDHHLIIVLVDRWKPETSTFHLTVREMAITFGDVVVLLGLPIEGKPLVDDEKHDYLQLCTDLLGVTPEQVRGNDIVEVKWYKHALAYDIPADATDVEIQQRARAIILHLVTSRLMCDHLKNRMDLK